jgi:hypothetical protein
MTGAGRGGESHRSKLIAIVDGELNAVCHQFGDKIMGIRLANPMADCVAGFSWSVSGRPGGGREFGDATDWKITQPGIPKPVPATFNPATGYWAFKRSMANLE